MSPDQKNARRKPDGLPVPDESGVQMHHGAPGVKAVTTADSTAGETPKASLHQGAPPADRKPAQRRPLDAELQTMAKIDRLLADLEPNSAARVLAWVIGKHATGNINHVIVQSKEPTGADRPQQ